MTRPLQLDLLKRRRRQPEFELHCQVIDFLTLQGRPDLLFLHPANGELREAATGRRLARMGVLPGAADLHLTLPPGGKSAWLELKAARGFQSAAQRAFEDRCRRAGALYAVANSFEAAREILRDWGALRTAIR